jgi:hypothetical protein
MGGPVVTRVSAGPHTISCSSVYFTHLMRCPADIDGDGDADAADLHAAVDVALSGEADLFESVTAWFAGCR